MSLSGVYDQTREAEPGAQVQGVVTGKDAAQGGSGDPTMGRTGSNGHPLVAIPPPGPAHRPFAFPAWPTTKSGPQATSPLPGQHPHPQRTDQMVYECYDQERGMPCVSPPMPVVQKQRGRTYLPDERVREAASDGEGSSFLRPGEGETTSLALHAPGVQK
jgi:hypothetical protein